MVHQNCQEETNEFHEPTLRREQTARSEDLSGELQGESGEFQPTESTDGAAARADFWSIQGDDICRHHNEPRVQPYVLIWTSCKKKRVDDYWNVDSNRSQSDSWKGFTNFTLLEEKPPKGYMWSGWRLTKVQTTTRTDHVCREVWTKIGKAAQNRDKQEWENEKPKLDIARRLRGSYHQDYKETQKFDEKIGKTSGRSHAVPKGCSDKQHESGCGGHCIPKASEDNLWLKNWNLVNPPRQRVVPSLPSTTRRSHCRQKALLR